ncbi:MAG: DUF4388 domain-containing protein [Actinomycetota bacterium]
MALQGTLADFRIDEVLSLLDHGKKRGRLRVTSPAASGNVWVDNGQVVASANNADEPGGDHTEVVFQLMRLEDGEFHFHSDDSPAAKPASESITDVLSASSGRLAEWKQLSKVLPSVEHWLALTDDISSAATIEPPQWKVLALIGGGTKIATCVDELGLGLVPGCRIIVELVERKLLAVTEAQPARAVAQSGRVQAQLPSVGAHEGEAEQDDAAKADAEADDAPKAAAKAGASAKGAKAKDEPADAEAEAKAKDEPADAKAEAKAADGDTDPQADSDAKAEAKDDAEAKAEGEPADAKAEAEAKADEADGDAPEGAPADTDADVNPRALLRLLNSVK